MQWRGSLAALFIAMGCVGKKEMTVDLNRLILGKSYNSTKVFRTAQHVVQAILLGIVVPLLILLLIWDLTDNPNPVPAVVVIAGLVMLCFFFCFVHLALWPATRTIPAPLLPLAHRRAGLDRGGFGRKPRLPHRTGMADPPPLPHQRPRAKQGRGDEDGIEPLPVAGWLAPLQVDRGHRHTGWGRHVSRA